MARKWIPTHIVDGVTDDFGYRRGENAAGMIEEESKAWYKAQTPEKKAEIERQRDERRLREAKEREKQAWPATRAGQLLRQLGECFEAYRQCVMEDPQLQAKALEFDEVNQKIFNKMKSTIDRANGAPRCQYPKGEWGDVPRATGAREEVLPHAPDDGRGAAGEDQLAEPG